MTIPSERTSREIRSGRMNRRPPSFVVTLVALAIVFGLAWAFFLRSGPSASAPVVNGVQGTYTWQPSTPNIGQTGTFSAVASRNAGGKAESERRDPRRSAPALGLRRGDPDGVDAREQRIRDD